MAAALPFATGGVVGGISSLLSKKSADAPAAATPAPVMPIADDAKVVAARKRAIATMQQRSGRASTILTNNSDTLGG